MWIFIGANACLCSHCGPRLSEAAADKLKNQYVMMRTRARQHEREASKKSSIPITVRYDVVSCVTIT